MCKHINGIIHHLLNQTDVQPVSFSQARVKKTENTRPSDYFFFISRKTKCGLSLESVRSKMEN